MEEHPTEQEISHTARAIGGLFLNFSALEHTMSLAVAAILKLSPEQEKPLVRGMMARAKIDMLASYASAHWNKADCETLEAILKPTRKLAEYRNDFAHGLIVHDGKGNWAVISHRGKHRFVGLEKPFTVTELLLRGGEAERLSIEFQALAEAIFEQESTGPLPQTR